jgi:hypothetical protein
VDWDDATAERYDTPATRARLWVPAPGLVVTRCEGIGDLGAIQVYTARMDKLLASGQRIRVFHHWLEVSSFQPEAREHLRAWATRRHADLNDAHYLVRSKIIAMAISVAALALRRRLVVYTSVPKFMAALSFAIAAAD